MLYFAAAVRVEKRERLGNIADASAAAHGGDFGKQRIRELQQP